jgi:uncharacterized membrane protein YbhN (UPF0104 family)
MESVARLEGNAKHLYGLAGTRQGTLALSAASTVLALGLAALAARHFADSEWPLSRGHPGLLASAALLFLLAYALKAYGWQRLFARNERPQALALASANGGAAVTGLILPGRFDDVIRIAMLRRSRACPAGVGAICLSLFMLGLIDAAALAPAAAVAAGLVPDATIQAGLALVAFAGVLALGLIFLLPSLSASRRLVRFRIGRWLNRRAISFRSASYAWALVSTGWGVRTVGVFLLLGALGVGFSLPLALVYLCASAAAAALPVGLAGAATQAGAGAAVLIAGGVSPSNALGVAVAVQLLGVMAGGSIVFVAALARLRPRLTPAFSFARGAS